MLQPIVISSAKDATIAIAECFNKLRWLRQLSRLPRFILEGICNKCELMPVPTVDHASMIQEIMQWVGTSGLFFMLMRIDFL